MVGADEFARLNLPVVFLAFFLSLALLCGGFWLYNEFVIVRPLEQELSALPQVRQVWLGKNNDRFVIKLELVSVENLKDALGEIKETISLASGQYVLQIKDRRNDYLEELWRQGQFAVEEAAVLGNLTEMHSSLQKEWRRAGLDRWLIEMDRENLYIQLQQGQFYLYEVVPRQQPYPALALEVTTDDA